VGEESEDGHGEEEKVNGGLALCLHGFVTQPTLPSLLSIRFAFQKFDNITHSISPTVIYPPSSSS